VATAIIVWSFEIAADQRDAFEKAYGPNGDWAQLFARSPDFIRTQLLRDTDGTYLTLDHWTEVGAFDAFKAAHASAYQELDAACGALTVKETRIGVFESVA